MNIRVVFNNMGNHEGLLPGWGMAALVELSQEKILFDTGSDGRILLKNLNFFGISPEDISKVIISHNHWDHTGGLSAFLSLNPKVEIYAPSLDEALLARARRLGSEVCLITGPMELGDSLKTIGPIHGPIEEQALFVEGATGNALLTGCAHPGVEKMISEAPAPIGLIMGGFHLKDSPLADIEKAAQALLHAGVLYVAPSHCTGDEAMGCFREYFKERLRYGGLGASFDL